jgi:hypothetical protein
VLVYNGSEATTITARVYDAAGRLVTILLAGYRVSGPTTVRLNTGDLSGGVYLLQVAAGAEARTYKLAVR